MIDGSADQQQDVSLNRRICFFGLTENFHPFFIPLAKRLESLGTEAWFFNFWPGEILSLEKNGLADRTVDWQREFLRERIAISDEDFNRWMSTDPNFPTLLPVEQGKYRRSLEYIVPTFRRVLDQYKFDAVFFWNGFKYPDSALRTVCEELGVKTFFGENGVFAHTMQIDPVGVNAAASIAGRSDEDWLNCGPSGCAEEFEEFLRMRGSVPPAGPPVNAVKPLGKVERLKSALRAFVTERSIYSRLAREGYWKHFQKNAQVQRARENRLSSRNAELPDRFIFVPFQVHDDTQITLQSPWVDRMETMLDAVIAARDRLGLDMAVVVKEHPVDVGRYRYDPGYEASGIVWLWDYPLDTLLERAACVVTVNSSVGLEAVLYGKPVVSLGNAIYNVAGVVEHAGSEAELSDKLKRALSQPVDQETRNRFLCKLRFQDLVAASWRRPTEAGIKNAADRILALLNDSYAAS